MENEQSRINKIQNRKKSYFTDSNVPTAHFMKKCVILAQ